MNEKNVKSEALSCILLLCSAVVFFFLGCATAPAEPAGPALSQADLTNRLTCRGITLKLPSGWSYLPNSFDGGSVFNFRGPGDVRGGLECLEFSYNISFEKLMDFYEKHVFNSARKTTVEIREHESLGRVVFYKGISEKKDPMLSLLSAEGNRVTFLYFQANGSLPVSDEDALLILENHTWEDRPGLQVRFREGFPLFSSFDNSWFWQRDFRDGYYMGLLGENPGGDLLAGLWTLSDEDVEEIKSGKQFVEKPFIHTMNVSNVSVDMTAYTAASDGRDMRIHAVFEWEDDLYCFFVSQDADMNEGNPALLLGRPEIRKLFEIHLLFEEIEL